MFFVGKIFSSKYGEIQTTIMKLADQNFDEKGNRIYLFKIDENYMNGNIKSYIKLMTAERLHRKMILTKEWTKIENDNNAIHI